MNPKDKPHPSSSGGKEYEEVNIKFLVREMEHDAEEYGALHNENCPCNMEDPDECDCENMQAIKAFAREWMVKVNEQWVKMASAHLPYCTREGRDFLTRGQGKVPRSEEWRRKIGESVKKTKSKSNA